MNTITTSKEEIGRKIATAKGYSVKKAQLEQIKLVLHNTSLTMSDLLSDELHEIDYHLKNAFNLLEIAEKENTKALNTMLGF
jgi:hypothetical protein